MKKIVAKVGEYTNQQGEQKNQWLDVGVILSNTNGEYIMLNPCIDLAGVLAKQRTMNHKAGKKIGDNVMCSIFDGDQAQKQGDRNAQQQARQQPGYNPQQQPVPQDDFDDQDIPF